MRDSTTPQLPIVVGIDGSQASIQAAEWAFDEAVSREVPLRLVEVITQQVEPAALVFVGNVRMEVEYTETAVRIAAAAVAADGKLAKVETAILRDDPATALIAESRDAAMACALGAFESGTLIGVASYLVCGRPCSRGGRCRCGTQRSPARSRNRFASAARSHRPRQRNPALGRRRLDHESL